MEEQEKNVFDIKKKTYKAPEITAYGPFSEKTRGNLNGQGNPDGGQYYGQDLNS